MSDESVAPVAEAAPVEVAEGLTAALNAAAGTEEAPPPKTEEPKAQTEEEKRWASKFAALTRKEKALRDEAKKNGSYEARIRELEAKLAAQNAPKAEPEVEALDVRLRKDPFKTLESMGMSYETLTQIALNNGKLTPELQMQLMEEKLSGTYKSELEKINKKLEERDKAEQAQRETAAVQNFKDQIATKISALGERSELVAAEGQDGVDLIYDIMDQSYAETGEVMDIEEAVTMAEEELLEQAKKRIELSKIKKLMGASQDKIPTKPQQSEKKASATLSNSNSQVQSAVGHYLSDEESKREAAKLIKFDN